MRLIENFLARPFADGFIHYEDWNHRNIDIIVRCPKRSLRLEKIVFDFDGKLKVVQANHGIIDHNAVIFEDATLTTGECFVFDFTIESTTSHKTLKIWVHWCRLSSRIPMILLLRLHPGNTMKIK
jgi:predicted sulfurtransferase